MLQTRWLRLTHSHPLLPQHPLRLQLLRLLRPQHPSLAPRPHLLLLLPQHPNRRRKHQPPQQLQLPLLHPCSQQQKHLLRLLPRQSLLFSQWVRQLHLYSQKLLHQLRLSSQLLYRLLCMPHPRTWLTPTA